MWLNHLKGTLLLFLILIVNYSLSQGISDIERFIENSEFNKALTEADRLINQVPDNNSKGRLHQLKADAYYYINDIDNSLASYLKAIELFELSKEPSLLHYMESVSHAGFCYREQGIYDQSLLHYIKALNLATQLGDSIEIAAQHANLGLIYGKLGDIDQATSHHLEAYNIDLALKDTAGLGFDLRNIADLKITLGEYADAITSIKESIKLLGISEGNANSLALRLGVLGKTYLEMNNLDSAEIYLNQSLAMHQELKDSIHVALRWNDLARLKLKRGQFKQSINLSQNAKAYFTEVENSQYRALANLSLSKAYLGLDQPKKALSYLIENIALCSRMKLLVELRDTYELQAKALEQANDPYGAIAAMNLFRIMQDSIVNLNNKKAVSLLEVKYEVYKKEQENEILALENALNKKQIASQRTQYILTIAIFIILIVAIATLGYIYYSRQRLKEKLLQSEVDQLRTHIKLVLEGDTTNWKIDAASFNDSIPTPLSDREFEILNLALSDLSNSQIADKISVSVNTVKYHLKNIYEKLGVGNRKEALQFAIQSSK